MLSIKIPHIRKNLINVLKTFTVSKFINTLW